MIASNTKKINLATAILIAPLRSPALLAKTAATLDAISQGRLELGLGTGWQEEEYHASGISFKNRASIFWETIDIIKKLWGANPISHKGENFEFEDIWCLPKPAQEDLPLFFGLKMNDENAKKIATYGHGWIPIKTSTNFINEGAKSLAKLLKKMIEKKS